MLVRLHEAAKEDESISIYDNIDFFSDIYANHWPHRHELPDPSLLIPFNLSPKRRDYVLEGYRKGIDASFFATNDMPVSYMSSLSKWLVESALEMKNWNRHTLKQIKLTFE